MKLPEPFSVEVATVYKSLDGRRYVSKRGAMFHSAIVFLKKARCTCSFDGRDDCWSHGHHYEDRKKAALRLVRYWQKKNRRRPGADAPTKEGTKP
jgi:hypothetical protein